MIRGGNRSDKQLIMYKIPEDFNVSSIETEKVFQIAFGINFITLFFNSGFIQFSGSFSIIHEKQEVEYDEVYPVQNDYKLLNLLEKEVKKVSLNEDRDVLTLEFEGDIILKLIGTKEFESFTININKREVIV